MFVLGLLLIVLSAGALVAVLASGTDDQAALYGGSLQMPSLVVFLAGAAALLLFIIGLELIRSGMSRANQNRKNNKRLRKLEREQQRRGEHGEPPATGGTAEAPARTATPGPTETRGTEPGTSSSNPGTSSSNLDGPTQAPPPASR